MEPIQNLNKKGQIEGIIVFIAVVVFLIIVGPILLKIFTVPLAKVASSIRPMNNESADAIDFGRTRVIAIWDYAILAVFIINVIILWITSFMTGMQGSHPLFLIIFIIAAAVIFIMLPNYTVGIDKIWSQYPNETAYMQGTSWLYHNFGLVLLGIFFICGVLMFISYRMSSTSPSGVRYG